MYNIDVNRWKKIDNMNSDKIKVCKSSKKQTNEAGEKIF
jgi:hypothetical protein